MLSIVFCIGITIFAFSGDFLSNFSIRNQTNQTLTNIKLYVEAGAEVAVYDVAKLEPKQELDMKIKVNVPSRRPGTSGFRKINIWAEGQTQ